jgi:ubiquinone/menaquinone biosynthesis C-methylase UbiE
MNLHFISFGDLVDLYYKIRQKGLAFLITRLKLSKQGRTITKWTVLESCGSDFWVIPEVRRRWNEKCTGDPGLEYEYYIIDKYFSGRKGLRLLSVGCGTGSRERKFASFNGFSLIEGIDLAPKQVEEAREEALRQNLTRINYHVGDFRTFLFQEDTYDIVLFNSSLHHFTRIDDLVRDNVVPILKPGGLLVIFDYTGPRRLQWTKDQLRAANELLHRMPRKYRLRSNGTTIKRHIYRPGLLRMILVDPSEAVDSGSILPSVHKYFEVVEEKPVGWDILHILLKDIAHNFLDDSKETMELLKELFRKEDEFIAGNGRSDMTFGIYRKKESK